MGSNLAYLLSRYPDLSQSFVLREVLELRRIGFRIEIASINGPDRADDQLTEEERAEAARTFYVKRAGAAGALRAHLEVALRRPAAYIRGIWLALRLGGFDLHRSFTAAFYFGEAVMVGSWMKARKLDHAHVHFATPASTVGLIMTKVFDVTFSMTVHGPDEFYDVPGYYLREKLVAASMVCVIGLYTRSQLMRLCDPSLWPKIKVAPLGVDPAVFTPCAFRPNPRVFEVLCVGRLVPAKGQRVLIAAVARLIARGRFLTLRIVGKGADAKSLEKAALEYGIESHVVFEGGVNQDHIRALLERADAFVLASFAVGIPVALMEAMAMEIPCVSTWITGIPELIRDSIDGLLVAPSDEEGLAEAIARLMDDGELRRRLGASGRRRVIEKYNLRPNVARLARLFDESFENLTSGAVA